MKTKLYIVSLLLILTFYSNTFAVDVSNSSDFSQNFNNSDINTIKVQNDITLDPVNQRTATISIFGSLGAERLTVNSNILRFVPNWNDGLDVSLSSLTFSQASNGAIELSGDGVGSHNFQLGWLTFIGDTSGSNGGAVYLHTQTQSQLPNNFFYLTDSVFVNNSALSGGAIYMASNNSQNPISFSVTTGMFSQNSASAGNGGAIYNYVVGGGNVISSYTIIGNNVFSNNSASAGNGGAIANSVSNVNNGVNTFIESAQFANNSAINGGAISNEAEGGNTNNSFNIFGTFTGNQASSCGGAIYSSIGKNGNSPYGGTNVYIISATFNSNSASDSGGAIYNYINKGQSSGAMYLSSNWNGNSAVSNGGAIYNYSDLDLYILSSSVFQNNSASLGGAIYNAKGNIYLTSVADGDITFLGNRASQGSDVFAAAGSVLYINGSFGQIYFGGGMAGNGTIVKSNGGMIYLANTSDNSKFNGQFNQTGGETQCEGIMFGGINDIYGGILKVCSTESYITYNVNLYDGATLNHWTRNLMLTNVFPGVQNGVGLTFKGNSSIANFWSGIPGTGDNFVPASYSLSKIDNGDKNTIIFNNSIVKLKGTDYSGNTIYSFADSVLDLASSSTTVSTYTFNNLGVTNASLRFKVVNSASGNLTSDTLYVTSPTASGAEIQIDKIYLMDDPSYSPIIGATVTVLTYQNDGALTFQNQTIEQYAANTNFAYIITTTPNRFGIYFSSFTISTEITLDMVNINSMSASGARSFQIPNKTTYSNGTTLHQMASGTFSVFGHDRYASVLSGKSTSGTSGSLFKIWGDTTAVFDLTDLTVQDAYASNTDYGDESGNGAVLRMVNGSTVSIIGVTIQNSSAVYSGGAVFQDSGVLTLSNIYFIGNSAGTNGGAVSHKNGDISISIAKFDSNTAVSSGGAIYNSSGSISIGANVLGTVLFSSNSAGTAGGAIYNDVNGQIELASGLSSDILFVNNSAGGQVNDIYNDGTIIIDGQAGNVNITGGISGNNNAANIIKSSYGDLTLGINSDNSKYVGSFTQTDGNINVYGKFFGGISTITGGILNWYATDHAAKSSSSVLNINNAVLQISGDGSFLSLNNNLDSISSNTVVIIDKGSELNIHADSVNLYISGGADIWKGVLSLDKGNLVLDGIKNSSGSVYKQTGGRLLVTNGSEFLIDASGFIGGGDITINNLSSIKQRGDAITGDNLTMDGYSSIDSKSGKILNNRFSGDFNVGVEAIFYIDVNAKTKESDNYNFGGRIKSISEVPGGTIEVFDFNLIDGSPEDSEVIVQVFSAERGIDSNVSFVVGTDKVNTAIGLYNFSSLGGGKYKLALDFDQVNKPAYRDSVAKLVMLNNQLMANNTLFDHIFLDRNKLLGDDSGENLWFKTYGGYEDMEMTKGIDVKSEIYGLISGLDLLVLDLNKDWKFMPTVYAAYTGGNQKYSDVSMNQTGLHGGAIGTFTKNKFIGAGLLYGGGYENNMSMEGKKDSLSNWFFGIAAKCAYNFDVNFTQNIGITLQPNFLTSFNLYGDSKWNSDYGQINMSSGYLKGLNVAPGINFIYNKNNWNVYIKTSYMYNVNNHVDTKAGNVELSEVSTKPGYFDYGCGGFVQITDSISVNAGLTLKTGAKTNTGINLGANFKF